MQALLKILPKSICRFCPILSKSWESFLWTYPNSEIFLVKHTRKGRGPRAVETGMRWEESVCLTGIPAAPVSRRRSVEEVPSGSIVPSRPLSSLARPQGHRAVCGSRPQGLVRAVLVAQLPADTWNEGCGSCWQGVPALLPCTPEGLGVWLRLHRPVLCFASSPLRMSFPGVLVQLRPSRSSSRTQHLWLWGTRASGSTCATRLAVCFPSAR